MSFQKFTDVSRHRLLRVGQALSPANPIFSRLLTRAAPFQSHDREGVVFTEYVTVFAKACTKVASRALQNAPAAGVNNSADPWFGPGVYRFTENNGLPVDNRHQTKCGPGSFIAGAYPVPSAAFHCQTLGGANCSRT